MFLYHNIKKFSQYNYHGIRYHSFTILSLYCPTLHLYLGLSLKRVHTSHIPVLTWFLQPFGRKVGTCMYVYVSTSKAINYSCEMNQNYQLNKFYTFKFLCLALPLIVWMCIRLSNKYAMSTCQRRQIILY